SWPPTRGYGMTPREREHHDVAKSFGTRQFSRSEFIDRYSHRYPDRKLRSIIPSDYCVDLIAKGTETFQKFMRWVKRRAMRRSTVRQMRVKRGAEMVVRA